MTVHQLPFGVLLRRWRERRRMTQADLAYAAESSTRHLSCLETGKAQPSREMIARLAEYLEIPLRDQNSLLLAAGFAPAFQERSLAALDAAKIAIEAIRKRTSPIRLWRSTDTGMSSCRTRPCRNFTRAVRPISCERQ